MLTGYKKIKIAGDSKGLFLPLDKIFLFVVNFVIFAELPLETSKQEDVHNTIRGLIACSVYRVVTRQ